MIPYYKPCIGEEEKKAAERVLESGWLTTGAEVKALEDEFAAANGSKYALAVSSCTAGLQLAIECSPYHAARIPNYTFIATFQAAQEAGKAIDLISTPCRKEEDQYTFENEYNASFNDFDFGTIVPVHIGGELCKFEPGGKRFIVEDCAHRFPGGEYVQGDIQVFSFYANKPLACGEGGIVCTNNLDLYLRMREVYYHGMDKTRFERGNSEYNIVKIGHKFNLSDLQASIVREQLKKIDYLKTTRLEIADRYIEGFTDSPVKTRPHDDTNSWHLFMIYLESAEVREKVQAALDAKQIGYSRHYKPLAEFPCILEKATHRDIGKRIDKIKYERSLSLPIYPDLSEKEQQEVIDCILGAV